MAYTTLLQLLAVVTCSLLVTCSPMTRRAAPSPQPPLKVTGHDEDHQRPPRSFEGQLTPAGEALLNSLHHTFPKRREVGGSSTTVTPPGAWLVNPDTPESGSSVDYRTERYHISDLFAESTG